MNVEHFLDTNIVVYAHDDADPRKRAVAQRLITKGLQQNDTAISVQVLSEFYVTATRKLKPPLPLSVVEREIELLSHLHIVTLDETLVAEAISLLKQYSLSYWDALILASAHRAGSKVVYSEDLSAGQFYGSLEVRNPFL